MGNSAAEGRTFDAPCLLSEDSFWRNRFFRYLEDLLEGAAFYVKDPDDLTKPVNGSESKLNLTDEINQDGYTGQVHEYYVVYQITKDDVKDVDHTVENTVNLSYNYSSEYSSAVYDGVAEANAKITITTTMTENLVVDFGLPVEYVFESARQLEARTDSDTIYGKVTVTSVLNDAGKYTNTVTYTPTTVLKGEDVIILTEVSTDDYTGKSTIIGVYPATSVYYEEGFADYGTDNWGTNISTGTEKQKERLLSADYALIDRYGYDSKYVNEATGPSNGTEAVSETAGNDATFTFTGTGVDIYANCTADTGSVSIITRAIDEDGNAGAIKKLMVVNTKMAGVEDAISELHDGINAYNIPIASINDLSHGDYRVSIRHTRTSKTIENEDGTSVTVTETKPVKLDGFRVYNTLEDSSVFSVHSEDNPTFVEMRNVVLNALSVDASTSKDYAENIAAGLTQVLDQNENGGAVILSPSNSSYTTTATAQDLLDNGPKNELFLYPGQALTFTIASGYENIQIGMKAVNDEVEVVANNGGTEKTLTITSSTDMFYGFGDSGESGKTIIITNNGDGILSVTDLKYFVAAEAESDTDADDSTNTDNNTETGDNTGVDTASVFGKITEEDLTVALTAMGYPSRSAEEDNSEENNGTTDVVVNPFEDVEEGAYYYDAVLWAIDNEITEGTSETTFSPDATCTRSQVVTFLWRAAGSPAAEGENPFTDVADDAYYYDAVLWAVENEITEGTEEGKFSPDGIVTRDQVVTFLWRAAGKPAHTIENPFTDVAENAYYYDAVLWAYENEITDGAEADLFAPIADCTRGQVVTFLYRAEK